MTIRKFILGIILLVSDQQFAYSQPPQFSIATDVGVQKSLKIGQQFWAFGHTIQAQFHITEKDALYTWLSYYTNGKFRNSVTATAKDPLTLPQQVNYTNSAVMSFRQFSVGWKRYLKGQYNSESGYNVYVYGGFGLLFGRVENHHSVVIDTLDYQVPVRAGSAKFKRLTADLGLGSEIPLGGDFYLYFEGRLWLPASDYPSKYVFVNDDAPLVAMFNTGIRILF